MMSVNVIGDRTSLWRAVDQDGEVVDVFLQAKREGAAAKRLFSACYVVMAANPGRS